MMACSFLVIQFPVRRSGYLAISAPTHFVQTLWLSLPQHSERNLHIHCHS